MSLSVLSSIWSGIKLSILVVIIYVSFKIYNLAVRTHKSRKQHTDIISLPRHWFWGNLINGGSKMRDETGRHPDHGFQEIWEELGQPSCYLFDIQPMDRSFFIIADPTIAEQVTQPTKEFKYSYPKSDTLKRFSRLLGKGSIIEAEGEEWKNLRKRLNRGFQPSHLHSQSSLIIDATKIFVERLEKASREDLTFPLKEYSQDLTTDIITQLSMEIDYHSQTMPEGQGFKSRFGFLTAARGLSSLALSNETAFNPLVYINPVKPAIGMFYQYIYDSTIRKRLTQILSDRQPSYATDKSASPGAGKAIVRLAVGDETPSTSLIENTVSQVKTFIFAGQDTTATLIQWVAYELSKASWSSTHAGIVSKLVEEHDRVFGPGKYSALDRLSDANANSENILNSQLPYTNAFIKETLRLHPPASTARLAQPLHSSYFSSSPQRVIITTPQGVTHDVTDLRIYVVHWLIHRNPAIWGPDALEFRPSRWLDDAYVAALPQGSWRPFERGPRNCIGQELAMMEAKVVLVAVVRAFEFIKVGFSGKGGKGSGDDELYNRYEVTTVPADRMIMKVKMRE